MKEKAIAEENDQLVKLRKRKLIEKNKEREREGTEFPFLRAGQRDRSGHGSTFGRDNCNSLRFVVVPNLFPFGYILFSASPLHFSDLSLSLSLSLMVALQLLVNRITSARWYLSNSQWPAVHSRHQNGQHAKERDSSSAYLRITFLSFWLYWGLLLIRIQYRFFSSSSFSLFRSILKSKKIRKMESSEIPLLIESKRGFKRRSNMLHDLLQVTSFLLEVPTLRFPLWWNVSIPRTYTGLHAVGRLVEILSFYRAPLQGWRRRRDLVIMQWRSYPCDRIYIYNEITMIVAAIRRNKKKKKCFPLKRLDDDNDPTSSPLHKRLRPRDRFSFFD